MVDKKTDTAKLAILPGVELTPEAQKVLSRQLNFRIVWGHRVGKAVAIALGLGVLVAAIAFAMMLPWTAGEIAKDAVMGFGLTLVSLIGAGLLFLGVKS